MSDTKKQESIYEEARRTVAELNESIYEKVKTANDAREREFVYTEGSYACGVSLGEIELWDSENDERAYNELTDSMEPLRMTITRALKEIIEDLVAIEKGTSE